MIATDFHLIPLAQLCQHEKTVLERLASLPTRYAESLLEEPAVRYPFLYYALLTHWPDLLGDLSAEEAFYNRYYWYLRMEKKYRVKHDFEKDALEEFHQLRESAESECDRQTLEEIERKVSLEFATNEVGLIVSFSDFSIKSVITDLGISLDETGDFFADVAPLPVSGVLLESLKRGMRIVRTGTTEKARSELIVSPVLLEVVDQLGNNVSMLSGVEWEVDDKQGLRGQCDFLMGLVPSPYIIEAPVLAIVEVKKENISAGIGQCIAEMVAARIFNQRNNTDVPVIFGVVTTGSNWRFLRLIDSTAYMDASEYHIKEAERIVGIIVSMFKSSGVTNETKPSPP